jgi:acetylornithine aminotransferase
MNASHLMNTYSPQPVSFARGEGAWLWDTEGKKYLDGLAGIAVNGLGHAHPVLTKALQEQVGKLIHTSNLFRVPEQERAAAKVCAIANMDNAFFANSGAKANEAVRCQCARPGVRTRTAGCQLLRIRPQPACRGGVELLRR